jgi:hypothetical protein
LIGPLPPDQQLMGDDFILRVYCTSVDGVPIAGVPLRAEVVAKKKPAGPTADRPFKPTTDTLSCIANAQPRRDVQRACLANETFRSPEPEPCLVTSDPLASVESDFKASQE